MSDNMNADLGTKALGLPKFPRFRDSINGYALVKAAYPDLNLPDYVYEISDDDETLPKRGSKLQRVQALLMKFQVEYIDEDSSGDENDGDYSDSEYIPPQRLRGGCDDDNYVEGDDIQFEVDDDFEYDEESAFSAHGFNPAYRNGDYRVVRLRGGADNGNHDDPNRDYDWPADLQDDPSVFLTNQESYQYIYEVDQPLGPLVQLDPYQPDDIFSMKLMSKDETNHHMRYSDEIDDLPDPRIYNISVEDLYVHVLLFIQDAQGPNAFHHYERYLRWVDPVKGDYQKAINLAWDTLYNESPPGKGRIRSLLQEPTLIATNFQKAAMRISHRSQIYRQIQIVIEAYVRRIENHFHKKLDKDFYDNVGWDMISALPAPKDSYLRWMRWRCYFRNRFNRYLDDPDTIHSPIDDITEGCPNWRDVDELRSQKRNWFLMDQNTAQYVSVSTKNDPYQEEIIPTHRAIPRKDILYWDLIPLWRPQDKFTPQQRIHNSEVEAIPAVDLSFRQQRMINYLQSDEPMWGRNVVQILDDPDAWDDDQYPPAPKKLKVIHRVIQESSDDSNMGS
jgi:hypothetical protein